MHFDLGGRIAEERNRLGLTQADMATACGVSRGMWGKYEKDKASMGSDVLARFASCGADINFIITGTRSDHVTVSFEERLERLKAASEYAVKLGRTDEERLRLQEEFLAVGPMQILPCHKQRKGIDLKNDECLEPAGKEVGPRAFPRDWLAQFGDPEGMALLQYSGTNMQPEIHPGDLVLYDGRCTEVGSQGFYIFALHSVVSIHRVSRSRGKLILADLDPQSSPVVIEDFDELKVLGRALWWCRSIGSLTKRHMLND